MTDRLIPTSEEELAATVARAAADNVSLAIRGGGTRGTFGNSSEGTILSTLGLSGITLYEPAEMVISARAGTPLAEIEATLEGEGQMLPFEPMDHRVLLGTSGTPTIGAIAAANISGPRRVTAGAARDHLIGIRLVNGYGEVVKSGGRVMKNVTGLDLVKLNAGAFGTLGVLTEVTFKTLPRPEASVTLCGEGLDVDTALAAMTEAMATPFEVNGAAFISASQEKDSRMLLRVEGFAESCAYRAERLIGHLRGFGALHIVEGDTASLWRQVRDAEQFAAPRFESVLRVHIAPSKASSLLGNLHRFAPEVMIDWAGGLIWIGFEPGADVTQAMTVIKGQGGYSMVMRGAAGVPTPHPDAAVAALSRRVKHAFDPQGIFNPGVLAGYL